MKAVSLGTGPMFAIAFSLVAIQFGVIVFFIVISRRKSKAQNTPREPINVNDFEGDLLEDEDDEESFYDKQRDLPAEVVQGNDPSGQSVNDDGNDSDDHFELGDDSSHDSISL